MRISDKTLILTLAPTQTAVITAKQDAIEATRKALKDLISSQASVAIRPKAVTADCEKAYPIKKGKE